MKFVFKSVVRLAGSNRVTVVHVACDRHFGRMVTVAAIFAEGVERDVFAARIDLVCGDRLRGVRAVQDPPAAFVLPHQPGVADLRGTAGAADDVADVRIVELVGQPEGFRFAVASVDLGGHFRSGCGIGIGEGITEIAALGHQLADFAHRGSCTAQVGEHMLDWAHVTVVRSVSCRGSEIDCRCGSSEAGLCDYHTDY